MATEGWYHLADLFQRRPNPLAYHASRSLGGVGSRAASESHAEFFTKLLDFFPQALRVAGIVESFHFFQLGLQLAKAVPVFGAGPRIEHEGGAAVVANNFQTVGPGYLG